MKKHYLYILLFCMIVLSIVVLLPKSASNTIIKKNAVLLNGDKVENKKKIPLSSMKIENSVVNFGIIERDTVLSADFKLINTGKNDIVIEYINPDCKCTNYSITKMVILPKDTSIVTLQFDTHGKNYDQTIYTTLKANTEEQMYKLLLKANIRR